MSLIKFRHCAAAIFLTTSLVMAGPASIGPPALVDGKPAPYARVKKHGRIWYPASVVGFYRKIAFSYDRATHTLFANGMETYIPSLLVEDTVYVDIAPQPTQQGMRPGMDSLQARRHELEALEQASPHLKGNTDARLMAMRASQQSHPWTGGSDPQMGPIIDLDPTYEAAVPQHMRPGARPPEALPKALPNRLPSSGGGVAVSTPPVVVEPTVKIPVASPSASGIPSGGIPLNVTSQGGRSTQDEQPSQVVGLEPIPVTPAVTPEVSAFDKSGMLRPGDAKNSVFLVSLAQAEWQAGKNDGVLRVKLRQKNTSPVPQSNLGSFAILCLDGSRVESSRTRSYLPDGTLAPGAYREGELVFRFSKGKEPKSLELEGAQSLSLPLSML